MKTIKYTFFAIVITAVLASVMYYGEDIKQKFTRVEYKTVPAQKEVVVTDEFAELIKQFKDSKEGQEVLNTWATQQALEIQRKKLDEIEAQTLQKEASL